MATVKCHGGNLTEDFIWAYCLVKSPSWRGITAAGSRLRSRNSWGLTSETINRKQREIKLDLSFESLKITSRDTLPPTRPSAFPNSATSQGPNIQIPRLWETLSFKPPQPLTELGDDEIQRAWDSRLGRWRYPQGRKHMAWGWSPVST